MPEYYGHKTHYDGSRSPLTKGEASDLMAQVEADQVRRQAAMPDMDAVMKAKGDLHNRLRDFGWRDGIYCPKDGASFAVIQFGSTGIFEAGYVGEWPSGSIWIGDSSCHPHGCIWKDIDKLDEQERARMESCMKADREMHEAEVRAFASMSQTN